MRKIKSMPYAVFCDWDNDDCHPDDNSYNGGGCYDGWQSSR